MSLKSPTEALKHTEYAKESDIPFQKIEHLGRGAYGVVDKVQRGSQFYARKSFTIYKHHRRRILDEITHEIRLANSIKHIHAVSLVETYTCGLEYAMIMEPVADGNLAEFIHDMDDGSANRDLVSLIPGWFGCLLAGLAYIHGQGIHHRDIKPQNLLYCGQNILFTDFGIAREFVEETYSDQTAVTGTRNYWAPESDNERRPGRKADIFSLGLVFLELIAIYSNTGSFSALQSFRPYSRHLEDVHGWITSVDMAPIVVEWYPTMTFVC
jgi:serine/threonine protein kinase